MVVAITAGHSNVDPGAVRDNQKEADFCADMRNYVAYYLRNRGIEVLTDGQGSVNAPLNQAITLAKKADIAVEFHLNAAAAPQAYGVEVLASEKDRELSKKIAYAIASVTGSKLRGDGGWKAENSGQHARLGFVRAGGLVVELEFISNKKFMTILTEKRWVVAKAIAEVLIKQVGVG